MPVQVMWVSYFAPACQLQTLGGGVLGLPNLHKILMGYHACSCQDSHHEVSIIALPNQLELSCLRYYYLPHVITADSDIVVDALHDWCPKTTRHSADWTAACC